jgi:hypothetical protein
MLWVRTAFKWFDEKTKEHAHIMYVYCHCYGTAQQKVKEEAKDAGKPKKTRATFTQKSECLARWVIHWETHDSVYGVVHENNLQHNGHPDPSIVAPWASAATLSAVLTPSLTFLPTHSLVH